MTEQQRHALQAIEAMTEEQRDELNYISCQLTLAADIIHHVEAYSVIDIDNLDDNRAQRLKRIYKLLNGIADELDGLHQ